jgi:hypothetical protein
LQFGEMAGRALPRLATALTAPSSDICSGKQNIFMRVIMRSMIALHFWRSWLEKWTDWLPPLSLRSMKQPRGRVSGSLRKLEAAKLSAFLLAVMPSTDYDGDEDAIINEYDPFAYGSAH